MHELASCALDDEPSQPWPPRLGLLSLWDVMLRVSPAKYIKLGTDIEDAVRKVGAAARGEFPVAEMLTDARYTLQALAAECKLLGLTDTHEMLSELARKEDGESLPRTVAQFDVLVETALRQMKEQRFLVLRRDFYGRSPISSAARKAFPMLTQELRSASNSFACGLDTACVFHCMRALEHALDAMAAACGLTWTKEQWANIIGMIEGAIKQQQNSLPRGAARDERLSGLSQAAAEFRYFKDGWRNYVTHNRVSYGEEEAREALDHVCAFTEHLAKKLGLVERP